MKIFDNLIVLELANNHWGSLERGIEIIDTYAGIAKDYGIKCAIKLQFRDVDNFVHKDFRNSDIKYIKKTMATKMPVNDYQAMCDRIRSHGLIVMSTPFDEASVDTCMSCGVDVIKIASSDISDKPLVNRIIKTKKPVIVSAAFGTLESIDRIVSLFKDNDIPLAINHCVAKYPVLKNELNLNLIDELRRRWPENVIGYSTHENNENLDWAIMMAYAKGARTFERHIDIERAGHASNPYNSMPDDVRRWLTGYKRAAEMCGPDDISYARSCGGDECYLDMHIRGLYAKHDLPAGTIISPENTYLAIPLKKSQLSYCEVEYNEKLTRSVAQDRQINIQDIHSSYSNDIDMINAIKQRGI